MTESEAVRVLCEKYSARMVEDPQSHEIYFALPCIKAVVGGDFFRAMITLGVDEIPVSYAE